MKTSVSHKQFSVTMLKVIDHAAKLQSDLNTALEEKESDGLLVLGVGLPRTGTMSFKTAVTQLYQARCYHAIDIFAGDQEDVDIWLRAIDGNLTDDEWKHFFSSRNYVGGADLPFCAFYKEFVRIYPEAKVVLTTRDFSGWYNSIKDIIMRFMNLYKDWKVSWTMKLFYMLTDKRKNFGPDFFVKVHHHLRAEGCDMTFQEAIDAGPEQAEIFFKAWETEVRKAVPNDRLLMHKATDGWEPLCKFLNLQQPDTPYPKVNDRPTMKPRIDQMERISQRIYYGVLCLSCIVVGGLSYYLCL